MDRISSIVTCIGIVAALSIVAYFSFSILYFGSIDTTLEELDNAIASITEEKNMVSSDISHITASTNEYKKVNEKVEEIVKDIEKNNISKYTTYNVASFLQSIIKIIPKNVQLKAITSDDNKNIVIKAQSNSYADLGYFISSLKLSGTLNNIKIKNVQNDTSSIVEIGGELP